SDQRSSGARDAFAEYPNITVSSYATNWDAIQSYDITTDELTKLGGDLNAVVGVGTGMAEAAADAILTFGGNLDDVVVGSFDITDAVIEGLENGNVDYSINQQPFYQAYFSVAACVQYLNGLDVPDRIGTPVAFVTLENLDQHR
ncbi:MAG: substrate-binding domain-containing protein, partial [Chloroflexota bacterium]